MEPMEALFVRASLSEFLRIRYDPCVLRRLHGGVAEVDEDGRSESAAAMAHLIHGQSDMDIVLMALFEVRAMLKGMGVPPFSTAVYEDLYVPLLHKSEWRQKFISGELEEGTELMSHLQGLFQRVLAYQRHMLSSAFCLDPQSLRIWRKCLSSAMIFCTDFDGTCTVEGTTQLLFGVSDNLPRWLELLEPAASVEEGLIGSGQDSAEDLGLRACLLSLQEPEKIADEQVIREGLLKGISFEKVKALAQHHVAFRTHCLEVLQRLASLAVPLHVVSCNWAGDLIRESFPAQLQPKLTVHSNDLNYDCHTFSRYVCDSSDKERVLQGIRAAHCSSRNFVVYVGDGINDILALLDADVGIVMGEDSLVQFVLSKYQVELAPLPLAAAAMLDAVVSNMELPSFRRSGKLFHATFGWEEVEQFLFLC